MVSIILTKKSRPREEITDNNNGIREDLTNVNVNLTLVFMTTEIKTYRNILIINCPLTEEHIQSTIHYRPKYSTSVL